MSILEIRIYVWDIFAMMSLGDITVPMGLTCIQENKYYMAAGLLIYALAQLGFALIQNQYLMIFLDY